MRARYLCHRLGFEPLEENNTRRISVDDMIFNDDDVALDISSYDCCKYNILLCIRNICYKYHSSHVFATFLYFVNLEL